MTNVRRLFYVITLLVMLLTSLNVHAQRSEIKRYTNLPALYIETFNYEPVSSKEYYIYANLWYIDENDKITQYDSLQIRGRGNSTWNMRKKPYRIKFKEKERFLGSNRANAKSWTLLANAGDKTLIRNAVTSAMSEFMGMDFSPAYKFVDFNLNGEYLGCYQISDQVEVRKRRVNVTEQDYPLTSESDITGGYLLEVDGFQHGNCFVTPNKSVPVRIHYPDEDEIDNTQTQYINNHVNNFESVLYSKDFAHKTKGYRCLVDSVSLANWIIGTEVSANIDGFFSIYFYKKPQDPRLYWGPMWDYDIAYDNDNRKPYNDFKMMADISYGNAREWIVRMWQDPWFGKIINNRYNQLLKDGLVDHLIQTVDSLTTLIDQSQKLNYNKWGINTRMYNEIVLYSSYSQYVDDLKDFIYTHCEFLESEFASRRLPEPEVFTPTNHYYNIINKGNNKAIDINYTSTAPVAGDGVCIWQTTDSRLSQQWKIVSVGDYFHITNREGNLALADPTKGMTGPSVNTGTPLTVAVADTNDNSQLWTIETQANGYFNLINKHTEHTANVNGGGSDDGNSIISYTTDSKNSTSNNRQWRFEKRDEISAIGKIAIDEPEEYALAYNPHSQIIHFGSETPEMLTFNVYVYNTAGVLMKTFVANEECSVEDLDNGLYIVNWKFGHITRSAKFVKQ